MTPHSTDEVLSSRRSAPGHRRANRRHSPSLLYTRKLSLNIVSCAQHCAVASGSPVLCGPGGLTAVHGGHRSRLTPQWAGGREAPSASVRSVPKRVAFELFLRRPVVVAPDRWMRKHPHGNQKRTSQSVHSRQLAPNVTDTRAHLDVLVALTEGQSCTRDRLSTTLGLTFACTTSGFSRLELACAHPTSLHSPTAGGPNAR
jgi:hypothetical protein